MSEEGGGQRTSAHAWLSPASELCLWIESCIPWILAEGGVGSRGGGRERGRQQLSPPGGRKASRRESRQGGMRAVQLRECAGIWFFPVMIALVCYAKR